MSKKSPFIIRPRKDDRRGTDGRILPGHTLNPKGRKPGSGYIKRCQEFMEKEGWNMLERRARDLVSTHPEKSKLGYWCMKMLAEYGFGKARVQVDLSNDDGSMTDKMPDLSNVPPKVMEAFLAAASVRASKGA